MGPKRKKKTKKQTKEEELLAEMMRREEAEQRAREEEARLRELERLRVEAKLKAKREAAEQRVRENVLTAVCRLFSGVRRFTFEEKIRQRCEEEWIRYLRCDRLPYAESAPSMNTHLFLWKSVGGCQDVEEAAERVETILTLLETLNDLIEEPLDAAPRKVANWTEVRESYRREMMDKIDSATFHLIRDIENRTRRIDFWTIEFKKTTPHVTLGLWGWLEEPVGETDKRLPPTVEFKESGITVKLPLPYDKKFVVLRVTRTLFDIFSDTSASFKEPMATFDFNLATLAANWYDERNILCREKEEIEAENKRIEEEMSKVELVEIDEAAESTIVSVSDDVEQKATDESDSAKEDPKSPSPEPLNEIRLPYRLFQARLRESSVSRRHSAVDTTIEQPPDRTESNESDEFLKLICPSTPPDGEGARSLLELVRDFDRAAAEEEQRAYQNQNMKKCLETLYDLNIPDQVSNGGRLLVVKDPNDVLEERDRAWWNQFIASVEITVGFHELNLRKFVILGGVYFVDLIKHVAQAAVLVDGSRVQIQYGDYNVERERFYFVYEPPKVTETKEDEEDKPPPDDNIDRLISIDISLPQHVLWFEAPTVVQWNAEERMWSSEHVYDIRFNDDKQVISCRLGKTDPVALAAVRFNNLPFQAWELRPDWPDRTAIVLTLTASTVIVEFLVKGRQVALQSLQNATGTALEPLVGQFLFPRELAKRMKHGGVDLFPAYDSFLYVEGTTMKNPVVEEHVYLSMAAYANVCQFSWSRWNLPSGREKVVFQMREALQKQNLPPYSMVLSDLHRTVIVNCSEVSPAFTALGKPGSGFYPDLYSLLSSDLSAEASTVAIDLDLDLISTVHQLLLLTKILSFS